MMLAMSNELEELALVNCNLGPGLLTTLGQKFRNLRKLDLSSNRRMLVDKEFISMLASCNFLTELKVRSCRGLANASLASMFKSCKQLESVDIMNCPGIGAEYVVFFVFNCPRLRQICVEESKLSDVFKSWASKKLVKLLLEEVLLRLPPRSTFSPSTSDVSLVSKRWLRLYRSTRSTLSLLLSPENCAPHSLSSFLSHFPHLSFLSLTIGDDVSNFSDHLLLSVVSSFPKLRLLCLQPNPLSLSLLLSLSTSCPHLTSLYIALSRPFSFHWLLFFHSLKNLGVHFTSVPVPVPGKSTRVDAASKGKSFDFTSVPVPGESKRVGVASKGQSFDDAELKLETLVLSGIRRGDLGLDWLWRSCKKLKKLQLRRCEGIGDDTSVSSFVNCFKGLQEVELRICGSISNEILSILSENGTSLSSLLVHDGGSGQGLFQFITHSCCNLRKLDLRLPLDVNNNHLSAVAQNFRGLSSLRLQSCCLVTGKGLKTIGLAMSNELEELALINCDMVEREPGLLTALGQTLRNLRRLDLSYNEKLMDKELISMLESCNCLRELKVRGCRGLTNASVVSTYKSCKQLEIVDIMNCPGIEAKAVELFVLNCLRLKQIHVEESKLSDVSRLWASKKFVELIARYS
ncbi:hypothetical protein RHSIM_Rhsim08G0050600 [Rhododendron simsii]|uniref:Uncharacterized protein n=1 Tax=Rhododendron simsii TaxID=118357 RepID=A0A834LH86_RHOSS|nr:hypothetical protein RHSIM_Rhsim08G0050600 [Rhododendron simsii]